MPKIGLFALIDLGRKLPQLEKLARSVPLADPMSAQNASTLDAQSLADWLEYIGYIEGAIESGERVAEEVRPLVR
ncbi:MAG: hypothetical protein H0T46_36570 [Deltaproteobacteria bacterium]|nr:hypothetical protein [Deltaproteobacteria bacterium]